MTVLTDLTVLEMLAGLRQGDFSSLELTRAHIAQVDALEPRLQAFVTLTPDLAEQQASAADRLLVAWRADASQPLPPLAVSLPDGTTDTQLGLGPLRVHLE